MINNVKKNIPKLVELIDKQNLNEYIKMVVNFSFAANKYFNDSEPWSLKNNDLERMETVIYTICEQIKNISILLNPIIPLATNKALKIMNIDEKNISIKNIIKNKFLKHDKDLQNLEILFKKIE